MIVLAGADLVLPDRVLAPGSLLLVDGRIAAIEPGRIGPPAGAEYVDISGRLLVPGFIDVHVHGVEGHDVLNGRDAVAAVASRLPRYGVTSFCPTSIACDPETLRGMLIAVDEARAAAPPSGARVVAAHLESNFINPDFGGAQPRSCLRAATPEAARREAAGSRFTGTDILDVIGAHRASVGIVTLAPEIDGGMELVRSLAGAGHIVSVGHSGATYEQAVAAIDAGVTQATHLFNRMSGMHHRAPGIPGAVLQSPQVAAELICDGFHVHPALMRVAIRMKGVDGILAITDGTAGSGLPVGARAKLGSQSIVVTERTAQLEDGTVAGSVLTMDGAFRTLVRALELSWVEAARLCATSPARQLGLAKTGRIEVGMAADLVVLDRDLRVRTTYIAGHPWGNMPGGGNV
jgi:N-acetylglucosamine-6-phosphate deacetylase